MTLACLSCGIVYGQNDTLVNLPWGKTVSADRYNFAVRQVEQGDIESYPTSDLRNSLTGAIPGLNIQELSGNVLPYALGTVANRYMSNNQTSISLRGSTNVICIVDDVPMVFNQMLLDPNQIESITLITSAADKAKFGPLAADGAIYIRTKGGKYNTPLQVHVDLEGGVGVVDRWPEWVNGRDYARLNNYSRYTSGYTPLYRNVDGYSAVNPYSMEYPNVDYRSLMMRKVKPMEKFGIRLNGGTKNIAYNVNVNGLREDGLYKVGNGQNFSKLNLSSKVTAGIGQYIEASVGFVGSLQYYNTINDSFSSYRSVPAIAYPLILNGVASDDDTEGMTAYGVSRSFPDNPYASLVDGTFVQGRLVGGAFQAAVDVDFGFLLKGLKSRTFANINTFYLGQMSKKDDYLAFYYDYSTHTADVISDHKGVKATGKTLGSSTTYQQFNFFEDLSYSFDRKGHAFDLDAIFYLSSALQNRNSGNLERQANLFLTGSYSYRNRYQFEAVVQYVGSPTLPRKTRYAWFPTFGASWNAKNESFLKDVKWLNNLKVYAQYGIIGLTDVYGTDYLYDTKYSLANGMKFGPVSSNKWFGQNNRTSSPTTIKRIGNENLDWQKLYQLDLGVEFTVLDGLSVSFNWYDMRYKGLLTNVSSLYPAVTGWTDIDAYDNYNSTHAYGAEGSIRYSKTIGDWSFSIGGHASAGRTVYDKRLTSAASTQVYEGHRVDDYWGYVCTGKYMSQEEIDNGPKTLGPVSVGDLKYEDLNGDGVIDSKDTRSLGHTNPSLNYAINLYLRYKGFDVTVVGTGSAFMQLPLTNEWFWNGWGDDNYSKFVLDNLGGAYPRLSYDKSVNNFQKSDFWLRDGSFFKIQNVELAYTFDFRNNKSIKGLRAFVRGANLLTISGIKSVDPEYIHSGVTVVPLCRTFTAGVKLSF